MCEDLCNIIASLKNPQRLKQPSQQKSIFLHFCVCILKNIWKDIYQNTFIFHLSKQLSIIHLFIYLSTYLSNIPVYLSINVVVLERLSFCSLGSFMLLNFKKHTTRIIWKTKLFKFWKKFRNLFFFVNLTDRMLKIITIVYEEYFCLKYRNLTSFPFEFLSFSPCG